jgi:hypothetical protein
LGRFGAVQSLDQHGMRWGTEIMVHGRSLAVAVAIAAKSLSIQCKGRFGFVYAPTGEVIFRRQN